MENRKKLSNISKDELLKLNVKLYIAVVVFFSLFNVFTKEYISSMITFGIGVLVIGGYYLIVRKLSLSNRITYFSIAQFLIMFIVGFQGGRMAELYTFFLCSHIIMGLYFDARPVLLQAVVMNILVGISMLFFYNIAFPSVEFSVALKGLLVADLGVGLLLLVLKWGNEFIEEAHVQKEHAIEMNKRSELSIQETKELLDEQEAFIAQIHDSSNEITLISKEVSSLSNSLNTGVEAQLSAMSNLSNAIMDISMKVQDVTEAAKISQELSTHTGEVMQAGKIEMLEMLSAMNDLKEASTAINKVINDIDNIAFQTNILALNAAVEAARAGSAGKGFAVVADEVSNLANKSAASAKSTASLMDNIAKSIEKGSKLAQRAVDAFNDVVESEEKTKNSMIEINELSNNQVESVTGLASSCVSIESVINTNKELTQTCEMLAVQLECQSEILTNIVSIKGK